jgi:hypothetical protein
MQRYLDKTLEDVKEINKTFKPIWKFTYKISGGEEERIRLVKRDPDNLLVSWSYREPKEYSNHYGDKEKMHINGDAIISK